MNLEEDFKGAFCFLKGDVVCLSVLLYEWSLLKERSDIINGCLVLLQLLRELNSSDDRQRKSLSYSAILMAVEQQVHKTLADALELRNSSIAKDLKCFMDVFDLLSGLVQVREDNPDSQIGSEYGNCVFGCFIQRCLMEYRKLTFTQVVGIHKMFISFLDGQIVETSPVGVSSEVERDYTKLVDSVLLKKKSCFDGDSKIHSLLSLVEMYCNHGYRQEAETCLQQCVRIAQEEKKQDMIKETLSWVIELHGDSKEMKTREAYLSLLEKREDSGDYDLESTSSLFEVWSKLKLCKERLLNGDSPMSVLDTVMEGMTLAFKPGMPEAMKLVATSLTASCWDHLGYKMVGQLYCGLTCNMVSHHVVKPYSFSAGHSSSVDSSECSALCIVSVAQYMLDQGKKRDTIRLMESAGKFFEEGTQSHMVLRKSLLCMQLQLMELEDNMAAGCDTIQELALYDEQEALYWTYVSKNKSGCHGDVIDGIQSLLGERGSKVDGGNGKMAVRLRLVLTDALISCDQLPLGMVEATEVIQICEEKHWKELSVRARLKLALIHLHLGSAEMCCKLITQECLLHLLSSGNVVMCSRAWLLLAQGTFIVQKSKCGNVTAAVTAALPHLNEAVLGFRQVGSKCDLRNSLMLLLNFYELLGNRNDQELVLKELEQFL